MIGTLAKGSGTFIALFLVGLYDTFVLCVLWDWFVVPMFHVPNAGFLNMYGLVLLIRMFTNSAAAEKSQLERELKPLLISIEGCIPEENRQLVLARLAEHKSEIWWDIAGLLFGQILGTTIALLLGFVVHILA